MIRPPAPHGMVLLAALGALGCESPDVFIPLQQFGGPAGVIEGTVTYVGPPPCTRAGHVVGGAVLLGFDNRLLPPPEGLGTSAASIDIVSGDELFAGIRAQLPDDPGGALRCPDPGAPEVTVSGTWAMSPLPAGVYQVRGFYDLDGDFDPAFLISNLPTMDDRGGGAVDNATEVLTTGAAPRYREITLGVPNAEGVLEIPAETGARVGGVAVTLGLRIPLERPVFNVSAVLDEFGTNNDPRDVVMASDYQMQAFTEASPAETERSFIRLQMSAGVPADEVEAAGKSPFFFPVGGAAPTITFSRQDVNGDGVFNAEDHVPDSDAVPALFPLSIFAKLSGSDLVNQSSPVVVIQGLTLYKGLVSTALQLGAATIADAEQPEAFVAVRPAALCLDPMDAKKPGALVVSRATDSMGNPLIGDPAGVEAALGAQFGRTIVVKYGCLPEGRYAMNLIYGTGQAWTVPNEAGVCAASETPGTGTCGSRPRLASQGVVLTVGPPVDPQYCQENPTPAECMP